ncbi:cubilin [Octopus sinensis]|uniref:Cubilin n=1 Tax=Octopus sinensis TaxID=2607531 RepID=A0A6P7TBE8_9MOLL|nr:cubilin [Octopus sinensis]
MLSSTRKLEFFFPFLLVLVKSIASYRHNGQLGLIECRQNLKGPLWRAMVGDSGAVVSTGYPNSYSSHPDTMCEVLLRTCNSCRFLIELKKLHFPSCNGTSLGNFTAQTNVENQCINGCDHLYISEVDHPYSLYSHQNYFDVNETSTYISISSHIRIVHCMSQTNLAAGKMFKINYKVVVKKEEFSGYPQKGTLSDGFFHSPNFPRGYAINGEIFIYSIRNLDPNGFIKLVFDDWDIAQDTTVQVYENNQNTPLTIKHFQRPIIVSNSNSLQLIFYTGAKPSSDSENIGFKASFKYLSEKIQDNTKLDCSATFPASVGGAISFYGLSPIDSASYDCVWVIRKIPNKEYNYEIHLHLKELTMKDGWRLEPRNSLEIHNGISSIDPVIARYTSAEYTPSFTWNTSLQSEGFYIRLRGNFNHFDRVEFSYASAVMMTKDGCRENFKLPCFNLLCIAESLQCDGVDHCGDNSDERPARECNFESEELHILDTTPLSTGQKFFEDKTVLYFLLCFCISKEFV